MPFSVSVFKASCSSCLSEQKRLCTFPFKLTLSFTSRILGFESPMLGSGALARRPALSFQYLIPHLPALGSPHFALWPLVKNGGWPVMLGTPFGFAEQGATNPPQHRPPPNHESAFIWLKELKTWCRILWPAEKFH